MTLSNYDVVSNFVDGDTEGQSARMYIKGDILFSYGEHFPLLVRMPHWGHFLMNDDNYSVSTSRHQSICRVHTNSICIPFTLLKNIGFRNMERIDSYQRLELIDHIDGYSALLLGFDNHRFLFKREGSVNGVYTPTMYQLCINHDKISDAVTSMIPEGALFSDDSIRHRIGRWYAVKFMPIRDMKYHPGYPFKYYKQLERGFVLPRVGNHDTIYEATRGRMELGIPVVSGSISASDKPKLILSKADKPEFFKCYRQLCAGVWEY